MDCYDEPGRPFESKRDDGYNGGWMITRKSKPR
jgi:hypothetical protein